MTSKLFNVFDLQLGEIVDDNPFNADVICANIQYAVSLCAKHTVSIRG